MVKTLLSNARGADLSPGQATKIPHAMRCGKKKKKNQQQQKAARKQLITVTFYSFFQQELCSTSNSSFRELCTLLEIHHIMIVIDLERILHFAN